jgi:hypothetical protein
MSFAEMRDDIHLRFTIDGDGFDIKSFEPEFGDDTRARNANYWMGTDKLMGRS